MTDLQKKLDEIAFEILTIESQMDAGNYPPKKTLLRYFTLKKKREKLWDKMHGFTTLNPYFELI